MNFKDIRPGMHIVVTSKKTGNVFRQGVVKTIDGNFARGFDGKIIHWNRDDVDTLEITSKDFVNINYVVTPETIEDILGPGTDGVAWIEENGKHFTSRLDEMLADMVKDLTD